MGTYSKLLNIEKEAESKTDTPSPNPIRKKKPPVKKTQPVSKSIDKSRNKEKNTEINQEIKISRFLDFAAPVLDEKPTHMQSFNYPSFVVDLLDDLIHDLKSKERKEKKKPKWRATKTTVFILAILFLVWDYKDSKEESVLHKAIFEDR